MTELREDLPTGARVIVAPGRAARPDTFRAEHAPLPARVDACPFCPGNEAQTPPEVARTGPGAADTPGWHVRVVPNLYPLAGTGGLPGAHEVVMLSPAHDRSFGRLDDAAAVEVLTVLRDRAAFHLAAGREHVQVFVNHGREAGASIEHPHAQLVALDIVPPRVEMLQQRFASAGRDLLGAELNALDGGPHVIAKHGGAVVWSPPAAISAFLLRVALLAPSPAFEGTGDRDVGAIAIMLRDTLARLAAGIGDVAYNVVVNTAPRSGTAPFHWWLDIVPRTGVLAGFEFGTGLFANVVDPELAASMMREVGVPG